MNERRIADEPRRKDDRHVCPLHDILQEDTEKHRDMVCKKIASKADGSEVKGLAKLIMILVSICCIVIAGQAIWLRSDSAKLDVKLEHGFSTIHRRISETVNKIEDNNKIRIENDSAQTRQLSEIQGQLGTITWRLTQIEKSQEPVTKGGRGN
jgi:hypothetical protein